MGKAVRGLAGAKKHGYGYGMELFILGVGAGLLILATIVRDLWTRAKHARLGSDPESDRIRRDVQRAKTLGQSHFVGLDHTGHHR